MNWQSNWNTVPQKVIKRMVIYDKKCTMCKSSKTVAVTNTLDCSQFFCENCKKYFISTTISETWNYETEE